ncbi:DoxX family protein [Amycolatopsis sp. H20-H5]|uniref:DoxX family protein n=1 Tax=Amycolatopsis sp. H20-H5 TaxID=3046309 RepID=UPI002DB77C25|nr:DoxX family protein [Amycolatopsis sp. H20-H5]MEC3982237.1 DoxX family protein [Amycolatopsis sp. H20-H5]
MVIAAVVMSLMLAALFLALGTAKLLKQADMVARTTHLGYSAKTCQLIGALEIAAAAGLVAGLFWRPLGIAAAVGLVALLVGATISHRRAGDGPKEVFPSVWVGLVAAATAVVGVASL